MNDRRLIKLLGQLEEDICKDSSVIAQILTDVKSGVIPEEEAARWIMRISEEDPAVKKALTKAASKLPEDKIVARNPTNRLPRLNPLIEAAIAERAQFDGDIPELRTGPLPEGMMPSVAVSSNARNPVAIGVQLQFAAIEMDENIRRHETKRLESISTSTDALQLIPKHGKIVAQEGQNFDLIRRGSANTDFPTYRRGRLPNLVKTTKPTGTHLATLPHKKQMDATWAAIATSQGRRSVTPTITEEIVALLSKLGFGITVRTPKEGNESPSAVAVWSVDISQHYTLHPKFSFFDIVAHALAKTLIGKLKDKAERSLTLEVAPLQQISERKVGWSARLYEKAS